ncbi:hypothetical protein G6F45_013810 [Rhizopus arrhizus]|nr:hypothetical protein G6F45_013810 [Rhizopus arrhizus]
MTTPTTISGQPRPVSATPPAATSTPILAATSLREHAKVLFMWMLSVRNRHSNARHTRLAASAMAPKPSITPLEGGTPFASLAMTSSTMNTKKPRISAPLARAAPASQRAPRFTAHRLRPYTMASPSMSTASACSALERATMPAPNSIRNIARLMISTATSTRRCALWSASASSSWRLWPQQ